MCGIAGYFNLQGHGQPSALVRRMISRIAHRGPDSQGFHEDPLAAIGFCRLALVDLAGGDQPLYNEDRSLVLVCNGEIYNHRALRSRLEELGHRFSTHSDVEVILHLYEELGSALVHELNGQFAFVLYDTANRRLLMARDHAGIAPLYYAECGPALVFASEAKAVLLHPQVPKRLDLVGLDQVICFPGLVSPHTFFEGIQSLPPGCILEVGEGRPLRVESYWSLRYPQQGDLQLAAAADHEQALWDGLRRSVAARITADAPVGLYLSGGLDSSLIACTARELTSEALATFSVIFEDDNISEHKYQRLVAKAIGSEHHELKFDWPLLSELLPVAICQGEAPVKETYNACSLALSGLARRQGFKAILTGEGADELFAGYPGYKFDALAARGRSRAHTTPEEQAMRHALWGADVGYERSYVSFASRRERLYSADLRRSLATGSALHSRLLDPKLLENRHPVHQRSCLDVTLRLADHLLTEHGDRMLLFNSVEGRYPFLDQDVVKLATGIPVDLKLRGFDEKWILKRVAERVVPSEIIKREKYGFHAPGSPWLLRNGGDWVRRFTAPEFVSRQGIFDPGYVSNLVDRYSTEGFVLDARSEDDFLMIVISTGILVESFGL